MSVEGQMLYLLITFVVGISFYLLGKKEGIETGVSALLVFLEDKKIICINDDGEIKKHRGTTEDANL